MKHIKIIQNLFATSFIIAMLTVGCTADFLDRPALGGMDGDGFLKSEGAGFRMLVACYSPIGNHWDYQTMKFDMGDQITDDMSKGGSDASDRVRITEVGRGNPLTTNEQLTTLWKHRFGQAISPCNVFLDLINEDTPLLQLGSSYVSKEEKQRWLAEVHFLRAFYYFDVAMYFGDIPIIDHSLTLQEEKSIVKSDAAAVLQFIIGDLDEAIKSNALPKAKTLPHDEYGRISHEAAIAFRAKVYLWMGDHNKAKADLKIVVESGAFDLIDDYSVLFNDKENGYKSKEAVFVSLRNVIAPYISGSVGPQMFIGRGDAGGWGGACPSADLVDEFEKGDKRLLHTVLSSGDVMIRKDGIEITHNYAGYDNFTLQHSRKLYASAPLRHGSAGTNLQETDWTFYHIRYADVLLMYAECLIETGDNKALAVELINKVRKRAFVTTAATDVYAKTRKFTIKTADIVDEATFESSYKVKEANDLRAALRHERRVELASEGVRFYDLKRWGVFVSTMQEFAKTDEAKYSQVGRNVTDKTWPYPIPQSEIDNVGGSLVQNENY